MMLKQIWGYLLAWVNGEDAELHIDKTWHLSWLDAAFIVAVITAIVWWIWK